jgi:ornithine carbamoyltransferase
MWKGDISKVSEWLHFLNIKDLAPVDLRGILDDAANVKRKRKGLASIAQDKGSLLSGRIFAFLSEKPSMRTRVSFDVGIRQMGGEMIPLSGTEVRFGVGESIKDISRVLSSYVDGIIVRTFAEQSLLTLAGYATVPIINGLTDSSHPCQVMADIMTYEEIFGHTIENNRILWIGDGNNVCGSFIQAAVRLNFHLVISCPPTLAPSRELLQWAEEERKESVTLEPDPRKAIRGVSAVITDTWYSMHDDTDGRDGREKLLMPYCVDEELMKAADKDAVFMHCLPAHRDREVRSSVLEEHYDTVLKEAENRLHVQKSIIKWCLKLL